MMQESASDVENKKKYPISPSSPLNLVDVGHTTNNNETNVISVVPRSVNASAAQTDYTFGRVLAIYQQKYALIESSQGLGLLALEEADFLLKMCPVIARK
nr:hypothetical protein [Proteus mirabilis]